MEGIREAEIRAKRRLDREEGEERRGGRGEGDVGKGIGKGFELD
jgi:hypothetical protein